MSFIRNIFKEKEKQSGSQSMENESQCATVDIPGIFLVKNSLYFQRCRYGRILSKNKIDDKTYSTRKNQISQLFSLVLLIFDKSRRISQSCLNNL